MSSNVAHASTNTAFDGLVRQAACLFPSFSVVLSQPWDIQPLLF
jgi:hypothetical protein